MGFFDVGKRGIKCSIVEPLAKLSKGGVNGFTMNPLAKLGKRWANGFTMNPFVFAPAVQGSASMRVSSSGNLSPMEDKLPERQSIILMVYLKIPTIVGIFPEGKSIIQAGSLNMAPIGTML
jgi:hypothetical protein